MAQLMVMQYIVLAVLLKQRFTLINRYLMNAFGFSDNADEDLSVLDLAEMSRASKIRQLINTKTVMMNKGRLLQILDLLQESHSTLCDLVADVNSLYAISNATIIVGCVTFGTAHIYSITAVVFGNHLKRTDDILIQQVLLLIVTLTKIFVYSAVCGDASVEARRPVILVETLKLHIGADQQKVLERLDLFSQHIQKTRFSFSSFSLVTFDYSLLGTFASTVTMYLIILVQLAVSSKSIKSLFNTTPEIFPNISSSWRKML